MENRPALKLFMVLLGCKPPGRHTEQHDIFLGIGHELKDLVPMIKSFWPEPERIHIDAWKEIHFVENHEVRIQLKSERMIDQKNEAQSSKLFLINLGGYQENKFEEQHYLVLTVQKDRTEALKNAKNSGFFKLNSLPGVGSAHIDDKYGIDIDDLFEIEEILMPKDKELYFLELIPAPESIVDPIHLGYLKLSDLEA